MRSRGAGRGAQLVVPPHDDVPGARPATVVAVTLGHLGYRTDWAPARGLGRAPGRRPRAAPRSASATTTRARATRTSRPASRCRTSSGSGGRRRGGRADHRDRRRRLRAVHGRAVQRRRAAPADHQVRPARPAHARAGPRRDAHPRARGDDLPRPRRLGGGPPRGRPRTRPARVGAWPRPPWSRTRRCGSASRRSRSSSGPSSYRSQPKYTSIRRIRSPAKVKISVLRMRLPPVRVAS